MDIRKPVGYWTGSDYVGTMPDGKKRRFVSDTEYQEAFNDILEEEMAKLKDFADAIRPLGDIYFKKEW